MKRMIVMLVTVVAIGLSAESTVQAQCYTNGYLFGAGLQANGCYGYRYQREQLPYFAQFPPVYYGQAIKRPYGISPYAAPAGVMPVEMTIPVPPAAPPVTKANPYFTPEIQPVPDLDSAEADQDTVTWRQNPFFGDGVRVADRR